jgi:hypothetical protein
MASTLRTPGRLGFILPYLALEKPLYPIALSRDKLPPMVTHFVQLIT